MIASTMTIMSGMNVSLVPMCGGKPSSTEDTVNMSGGTKPTKAGIGDGATVIQTMTKNVTAPASKANLVLSG